mgnify:CR=1 FL=1
MNGYNIKVEIQGIDTSKLPRLSSEEQMEMLRKIKSGREDLKEEFVDLGLFGGENHKIEAKTFGNFESAFSISAIVISTGFGKSEPSAYI